MADIATGTIHNIGNILNSIRTSFHILQNSVKKSEPLEHFIKANKLLKENVNDLESFILKNPKGKKLIDFYLLLDKTFKDEHNEAIALLTRLSNKIDAIVGIITAQQSYAGSVALEEICNITEIIEDALIIQQGSLEKFQIRVEKNFNNIPDISVQKIKLVHILVNLIKNAKEAMEITPVKNRKLIFQTYSDKNNVFIKTTDTGSGILPEHLTHMFTHGFTTKKDGYGFGLHSCANYMSDMNGKIWAESEGEGKGATFVLEFQNFITKKTLKHLSCKNNSCAMET